MAGAALSLRERWDVRPAGAVERAFYGRHVERVLPESVADVAEAVRYAEARRMPIIPAGLGSRAYLGDPPPDGALVISLERLGSILRYEPGDFTIGAAAGLPLAELREVLERNGQEVAVDLPRAAEGTVGGQLACALPGPRRARTGSIRSALIGIRAMRGGGRVYKAGGMVVKNVAGYEVGRLHAGALGTAGIVLEANFKLRPRPAVRRGAAAATGSRSDAVALARALRARGLEPACLEVLDAGAGRRLDRACPSAAPEPGAAPGAPWRVVWLFEGNEALVRWLEEEAQRLCAERRVVHLARLEPPEAEAVFDLLCRVWEPEEPAAGSEAIVRCSVLPSRVGDLLDGLDALFGPLEDLEREVTADAAGGQVAVRWRGARPRLEAPLAALPEVVRRVEGVASLVFLPAAMRRRFGYRLLEEPSAALARRVRRVFDPLGLFCPGRVDGVVDVKY